MSSAASMSSHVTAADSSSAMAAAASSAAAVSSPTYQQEEMAVIRRRIMAIDDEIQEVKRTIVKTEKMRDSADCLPIGSELWRRADDRVARLEHDELKHLRTKEEQLRDELKRKEAALERAGSNRLDDDWQLRQQVQQLTLKQQQLIQQQEQEKLERQQLQQQHEQERLEREWLQFRVHRLEHTVTTAGDVGSKVLARATVDSAASFLPSLPSTSAAVVDGIPRAVHTQLQLLTDALSSKGRKKHNASSLPSIASAAEGKSHEGDDDSDREDEEEQKHGRGASSVGGGATGASMKTRKETAKKSSGRSNTEQILQDGYNVLFPHLIRVLASSLHFHDTSVREYLTNPTGKIDITLSASGLVAWPDVVTLAELKPSLHSKPAYEEAVGQVIQRCQDIFDIQEKRSFVVAMVMDGRRIDVLRVARSFPVQVVHTGCLPLELSNDSVGFKMLLRVLSAPADQLGFVAPLLPEPFELPPLAGSRPSRTRHVVKDFVPLRVGSLSLRTSAIYRASCNRWPDGPVVIKFTPASADGREDGSVHEATVLASLSSCSASPCASVPTLLAQGVLPQPIEHLHHYIIIRPYGRLLPLGEDASATLVRRVFSDVCEAMRFAYEQQRLLHRDISYGNIVHVAEQGFLIDWHVAYPQQATCFTDRITGTPLFTAHRLHFPEHAHDLRDDLESLLYVLIYIAMGGRLPWDHEPHKSMDALKKWHLGEASMFRQLVDKCTLALQPIIQALRDVLFSREDSEWRLAALPRAASAASTSAPPTLPTLASGPSASRSLDADAGLALLQQCADVLTSSRC